MFSNSKKMNGFLTLVMLALFVIVTGCSDTATTPTAKAESEILIEYLEGAVGGDYINVTMNNLVTAAEVKQSITGDATKYFVMDIRDTATYKKGHIAGSVNVQFKDILTYFKSNDLTKYTKVYMVCFSGQSAAYATGLLRMSGYTNVFSMKFGMASWHSDFMGTWKNSVGNAGASVIAKDSVAKPIISNLPTLTTGKTDGKEILNARVAQAFADGFPSVSKDLVLGGLNNYFVAAYWSLADYKDPGHVPGAPCYVPKLDFKSTVNLKTLPTNKTIAIYCYTGHTAAYAAAFLKVMGYDIKTISFGGNAMFYDLMVAKNKSAWKDAECLNYEIVK